ncbi:MAG: hypothetical protein Q7R63_02255, partial [bacterium]|nr:hypothetical protein [bacterium]
MQKRFLFVCGDIGGAELQCRVIPILHAAGHAVSVIADSAGLGSTVFQKNDISLLACGGYDDADCLFLGTCGTANSIERAMAWMSYGHKPVVLASDGFFNHGLLPWRNVQADYWCAINTDHAKEIKERHSDFRGEIVITGQPAFDNLPELCRLRETVRYKRRHELGFTKNRRLMVWWSQGMKDVLEEDVVMACEAVRTFADVCRNGGFLPAFIPMVHPKVEKIRVGYVASIMSCVRIVAEESGVPIFSRGSIPFDELNLAADLVCAVTSTEEIKSTLVGGPPVIHFLGPAVRQWFSVDLGRTEPYLPDILSGQSLGVYGQDSMHAAVLRVMTDDDFAHNRFRHWSPPTINDAAVRIA